ncbi:MAG: flagellar protein FlaG, partial [Firmicutes bacterium]|nr:flagellar protein FlaG [Bacillota bacterium]
AANKQNSKVKSQEEVVTPEVIEAAAEAANRIALAFGANIKFEIDEETHIEVLKVIDADTGQVIKEMPPKAILAMLDKLWETIGVFIDEKA